MHTLAFGHRDVPAVVHTIEGEGDIDDHVLTAAEAHAKQMPLRKQMHLPAGQDPGACLNEARRVFRSTVRSTFRNTAQATTNADASTAASFAPLPVLPSATLVADMPPPVPVEESPDELLQFIVDDDTDSI